MQNHSLNIKYWFISQKMLKTGLDMVN